MKPGRIIFIAASLVVLAACAKETIRETSAVTGVSSPVTYTATVLASDNALVKTTLVGSDAVGYDVVWSSGDDFRLLYKYGRQYSYLL